MKDYLSVMKFNDFSWYQFRRTEINKLAVKSILNSSNLLEGKVTYVNDQKSHYFPCLDWYNWHLCHCGCHFWFFWLPTTFHYYCVVEALNNDKLRWFLVRNNKKNSRRFGRHQTPRSTRSAHGLKSWSLEFRLLTYHIWACYIS